MGVGIVLVNIREMANYQNEISLIYYVILWVEWSGTF